MRARLGIGRGDDAVQVSRRGQGNTGSFDIVPAVGFRQRPLLVIFALYYIKALV